jgi:hypothetical protein
LISSLPGDGRRRSAVVEAEAQHFESGDVHHLAVAQFAPSVGSPALLPNPCGARWLA